MTKNKLTGSLRGRGAGSTLRSIYGAAQKSNRLLMVLERVEMYISILLLLSMMVISVIEITLRRLTGYSMAGVFEGMELMLVAVVYLGLAHVQSLRKNVRVEILTKLLPFKLKRVLEIVTMPLILVFFGLATWMTAKTAWASWLIKESTFIPAELPIWAARFVITIGFFFLWLRLLIQFGEKIFKVSAAPKPEVVSREHA